MVLRVALAASVLVLGSASRALAYIDPGTGGYVYSMIAPLLAFAGAGLAFAFRPVRRAFGAMFSIFKSHKPKAD